MKKAIYEEAKKAIDAFELTTQDGIDWLVSDMRINLLNVRELYAEIMESNNPLFDPLALLLYSFSSRAEGEVTAEQFKAYCNEAGLNAGELEKLAADVIRVEYGIQAEDNAPYYLEDLAKAEAEEKAKAEQIRELRATYDSAKWEEGSYKKSIEIYKELKAAENEKLFIDDNLKYYTLAAKLPQVVKIWNKYEGKQYGQKTKEKIREEIKEAAGLVAWLSDGSCINIYPATGYNKAKELTLWLRYGAAFVGSDNKIHKAYIADIASYKTLKPKDPKKAAAEMTEGLARIEEERKKLQKMLDEFNADIKPLALEYLHINGKTWY